MREWFAKQALQEVPSISERVQEVLVTLLVAAQWAKDNWIMADMRARLGRWLT